MNQSNIVEWKAKRLRESEQEHYCQVCLKLESIAVSIGVPAKLCSACMVHYYRDIEEGKA
jgi:hypothetical protein